MKLSIGNGAARCATAFFTAMLAHAQHNAATSTSVTPARVAEASRCEAMSARPATATAEPVRVTAVMRSRKIHAESPMVKNTWDCTRSEASPGDMSARIA